VQLAAQNGQLAAQNVQLSQHLWAMEHVLATCRGSSTAGRTSSSSNGSAASDGSCSTCASMQASTRELHVTTQQLDAELQSTRDRAQQQLQTAHQQAQQMLQTAHQQAQQLLCDKLVAEANLQDTKHKLLCSQVQACQYAQALGSADEVLKALPTLLGWVSVAGWTRCQCPPRACLGSRMRTRLHQRCGALPACCRCGRHSCRACT
jgi:DNA repair exonuclease SbcCD ATPase subunit